MDNALHQITVLAASTCVALLMVSISFKGNTMTRFADSIHPPLEITQNLYK